jgi:hypothetical protein
MLNRSHEVCSCWSFPPFWAHIASMRGSILAVIQNKEQQMPRFKINRNINKEEKHLLQTKLDGSLIEDVNLLCKWSGNDKNYVVAELLRFALSQESDFQDYKQSISKQNGNPISEANIACRGLDEFIKLLPASRNVLFSPSCRNHQ